MSPSSEQCSASHGPSAADALLDDKYRKLTRTHLEALPRLYQKLTGLTLCLAWAPAWPHRWEAQDLPTRSWLCGVCRGEGTAARARCQRCGTQHLALTVNSGHQGHFFTCHQGVRNFWFPIVVRHHTLAIAFVQALTASRHPAGQKPSPMSTPPAARHTGARRRVCVAVKQVSRQAFDQAAGLLRLIFEHVQTSALSDLREEDLTKARQAVMELQTVAARFREDLNGLVPAFRRTPPVPHSNSRAQGIVYAVMEQIQREYARPITLRECARNLHLNAAYLSALFSRFVGLPFKTFLTEVRLERARELLSDAGRSISEVAQAVGYASENRFRIAFKRASGLPPRVWRETLRMQPPEPIP